ncbi:DUF86 domain-containing protein [bacterium]|nr:DUF86 domain-containing protein [bacterium]
MKIDDVVINKTESIKRCIFRVKEEYEGFEKEIETNFTKQDSIVLNIQRACELSIDLANHVIKQQKLEVPKSSRESFALLEKANFLSKSLSEKMQAMVGFRDVLVHDYQKLNPKILKSILEKHLQDFSDFTQSILKIN